MSTEGLSKIGLEQLSAFSGIYEFCVNSGNCSITEAKILCLGEVHNESAKLMVGKFVNLYANGGDIVLVERVARGEAPPVEEIRDYQFTDRVKIFGWDDMVLVNKIWRFRADRNEILKKISKLHYQDDKDQISQLRKESSSLNQQEEDIIIKQRNPSLIHSFQDAREQFPDKRIFLSAGRRHFSKYEDPHIIDELRKDKYISLITSGPMNHM
ncbi:MAG: hypothetical protein AAB557_06295 [Patescibacteria group bacterium]